MNVQGDQAPQKRRKMLKKFENPSTKTVVEQFMTSQTPMGSVKRVYHEILTEYPCTCAAMLLHHDNAPAHTSLKTTEFVTNNNMVIVPRPPYSPDLAPCDFGLFPKLKLKLKRRRSATSKRNRKQYSTELRKMTSTVLLKRGKKRWDRCIRSQGNYFEGGGSQN
jgi:transposase